MTPRPSCPSCRGRGLVPGSAGFLRVCPDCQHDHDVREWMQKQAAIRAAREARRTATFGAKR